MSGKLFKQSNNPAEPILAEIAPIVQNNIINELLSVYPELEYVTLGSVGKKSYGDYNGDIDIGIKTDNVDSLYNIISNVFNYCETAISNNYYIVSICYPYQVNDGDIKFVSVDFIVIHDIEYAKFRYYCPNYVKQESKYKVGSKIMYVGTILNHCITGDYIYRFLPIGLYKCVYNKDHTKYKLEYYTSNPQQIVDIMFNNETPSVCNSIETLWNGIHSDKFKYPEQVKYLELALFVNSFRKGWEELIKPEDFDLQYWTTEEINNELNKHKLLRSINNIFN